MIVLVAIRVPDRRRRQVVYILDIDLATPTFLANYYTMDLLAAATLWQ